MAIYLNESEKDSYTIVSKIDGKQYTLNKSDNDILNYIVNKILHLMYQSEKLDSILILTDTSRNECELRSRISLCIGEEQAKSLWIQTYYNFYIKFFYKEILPIDNTVKIYEKEIILRYIIKLLQLNKKNYKLERIINEISYAKQNLILPNTNGEVSKLSYWEEENLEHMPDIYTYYRKFCKDRNLIDYDDFTIRTLLLFKEHPEILRKYIDKFDNILISNEYNLSYIDNRILFSLLDRKVYTEGEHIDYRFKNYRKK